MADVCDDVVWDNVRYDAWLVCRERIFGTQVFFSAAGDEPVRTSVVLVESEANLLDVPHEAGDLCYRVLLPQDVDLFGFVFGFARIEVTVDVAETRTLHLSTKEITCLTKHAGAEREIAGMLRTLLDEPNDEAIRWMVAGTGRGGDLAMLDTPNEDPDYSRSLADLADAAEEVVRAFETHMGFFRTHAHNRIQKAEQRIPASKMRLMGDREMRWILQHADLATEVPTEGGIEYGGSYYMPRYVQTSRRVRSYDNYENRVLLALAQSVERTLAAAERRLTDERAEAEKLRGQLCAFQTDGYAMPALVVVDLVLRRGAEVMARLERARSAMRRIQRQLAEALPDVTVRNAGRLLANPKRTKVFQEVRAYSHVFQALMRWKSVEALSMGRENLGMHALRASKLYEYYCLHELLSTLYDMGYRADEGVPQAFERARYSLEYSKYANERRVATLYHLRAGEERVDVYYQPVLYGSETEENGIDLHRVSTTRPFEPSGRADAPYTPDFVIYHRCGDVVRRMVFDAKFMLYSRLYSEGNPTMFMECMRKYILETIASDGSRVDAMWLLSAIGDRDDCLFFEESAWAHDRDGLVRSGIACVNPTANALRELLRSCGIGDRASNGIPEDAREGESAQHVAGHARGGDSSEEAHVGVERVEPAPADETSREPGSMSEFEPEPTSKTTPSSTHESKPARESKSAPASELGAEPGPGSEVTREPVPEHEGEPGLESEAAREIASAPEPVHESEAATASEPVDDLEGASGLSVPLSDLVDLGNRADSVSEGLVDGPDREGEAEVATDSVEPSPEEGLSSAEGAANRSIESPAKVKTPAKPKKEKKPKKPKRPKPERRRSGRSGELGEECVALLEKAAKSSEYFVLAVGRELESDGGAIPLREGFYVLRTRQPSRGQMRQYAKVTLFDRELFMLRVSNPVQLNQIKAVLKSTYGVK